ncbi:MAG TPA: CAP domain-containing protein [Amaricoccus sp.]|nr:CAP domain-containing protein [Amaricoccus sp.]
MRRVGLTYCALAALVVAEPGAAGTPRIPPRLNAPITVAAPDQTLFNEAVLIYSNAVRREHGRPPLHLDPGLSRAAAEHARNMARLRTHSHELPIRGQQKLSQRIKRQSLSYRQAAENIAMDKVYRLLGRPISMSSRGCSFLYGDTMQPVPIHTYASLAQQVVARWLASPKHRASLLSASYQRLGAGVGIDPGGPACGDLYLVQDFAD